MSSESDSFGGSQTDGPDLPTYDEIQARCDRFRAAGTALGICGGVASVIAALMLPYIADDPTTVSAMVCPVVIAAGCFAAAWRLMRAASSARAELARGESAERAQRWRAARALQDKRLEEDEAQRREEARVAEDERRVAVARALYKRGGAVPYESPITLAPGERCIYVCMCRGWDARLGVERVRNAELVITTSRIAVIEADCSHVSPLSDILRFMVANDRTVRLWIVGSSNAYDLDLDYPLETIAHLLIAFKAAGLTPPRPASNVEVSPKN